VNNPQLIVGEVQHARTRPAKNAFRYPIFNVRLPLANVGDALSRESRGLFSFYAKDHGARDGSCLDAWAREQISAIGIGEPLSFELVCLPRVMGYVFNPVSFWLCWSAPNQLRALIAEVNNTFGERLSYVLVSPTQPHIQNGETLVCKKRLHVSPFNEVKGDYRFRIFVNDTRFLVRIEYDDCAFSGEPLLTTCISGACEALTRQALWRTAATMPLLTLQVVAKIHWQALKLIAKRVRFFGYLPSEGRR
jgi:uncharacterized protein